MTDCTPSTIAFPRVCRRQILADFGGGEISSLGGALLLSAAERRIGLLRDVARRLEDERQSGKIRHRLPALLRQRVFAVALGYEDVNDHDALRHDLVLQTAVGRDQTLASASTIGRLDRTADRKWAWAAHVSMLESFIASFKAPPEELVLDFDATDDAVHGNQERKFYHGYYDHYCFLPLYVFCGDQLLVSYLRPSKIDGAKHAWAILSLLVKRLREVWPKVRIILRADSGFCRHKMLSWCERRDVHYIVGLARNSRLADLSKTDMAMAQEDHDKTAKKQRRFAEFRYGAKTWGRARRVIARLEYTAKGANPRYVVTNLEGDGQELYDRLYCRRAEMENRIKEQQLDLFADRTSCHRWWPNQFRLILASLAYILIETIRRVALKGSVLARAQCGTLRLKLLKIGAVVTRNTRRVCLHLSSACPDKKLFAMACAKLKPG